MYQRLETRISQNVQRCSDRSLSEAQFVHNSAIGQHLLDN